MKLDFLDDTTDHGKYPDADPGRMIRLYHFNPSEALQFMNAINSQIISRSDELDISDLDFIYPVNCKLIFGIADHDIGIQFHGNKNQFFCKLSLKSYKKMVEIIEPFTKNDMPHKFNWLYDANADSLELLFSPDGHW